MTSLNGTQKTINNDNNLIIFSIVGGAMMIIVMVMLAIVVRMELNSKSDEYKTSVGGHDNQRGGASKKVHCEGHCAKHPNENQRVHVKPKTKQPCSENY